MEKYLKFKTEEKSVLDHFRDVIKITNHIQKWENMGSYK